MTSPDALKREVKRRLEEGQSEKDIKDSMWNSGYTQGEITQAFSDKPQTSFEADPAGYEPAEPSGGKGKAIALALILVLFISLVPFLFQKTTPSGERVDIESLKAYKNKLDKKISEEGGIQYSLEIQMKSGKETSTVAGKYYRSGDNERTEVRMTYEDYGLPETMYMVHIINENGTYEGTRKYEHEDYVWTREDSGEDMLDYEEEYGNISFYNQGDVDCGDKQCTKIYAEYEGSKVTAHCRDDGLCPYMEMDTPFDYTITEYRDISFGPQNPSLFEGPAEEDVLDYDFSDYGFLDEY